MNFTALYHSSSTDEGMSLHAAGCRDIKREQERHSSNLQNIDDVASVEAALDIMVDEELQEMGYGHHDVKVHNCTRRSGSAKEGTMTQTTITTLDKVEVGQYIRPIPGKYTSRLTRTQRKTQQPVTLTFGDEFAGGKFVKVSRHGAAKRAGTYDVGFGPGQSWHAYPGTVKVEVRTSARTAKQERLEGEANTARKTARTRKATVKQTEGDKENPPTTKRTRQPVDETLAGKVKKLRDEQGMAWWKIAVELKLPGNGPLPAGKRGAGQARKLYRAVNDGALPASARSNGGSRNTSSTTRKSTPARRRRNALGLAAMNAAELRDKLEGKQITYRYADEKLGEAEPVKVEKIKKTTLMGKDQRLSVTFFSDRSKNGYGNERTVYVDQIVEVR